jgi:hypothetical protein
MISFKRLFLAGLLLSCAAFNAQAVKYTVILPSSKRKTTDSSRPHPSHFRRFRVLRLEGKTIVHYNGRIVTNAKILEQVLHAIDASLTERQDLGVDVRITEDTAAGSLSGVVPTPVSDQITSAPVGDEHHDASADHGSSAVPGPSTDHIEVTPTANGGHQAVVPTPEGGQIVVTVQPDPNAGPTDSGHPGGDIETGHPLPPPITIEDTPWYKRWFVRIPAYVAGTGGTFAAAHLTAAHIYASTVLGCNTAVCAEMALSTVALPVAGIVGCAALAVIVTVEIYQHKH